MAALGELYIGIMSGTSLDGIDVSICRFGAPPKLELRFHETCSWPEDLRSRLAVLVSAEEFSVDELTTLNFDLSRVYAASIEGALEESGIDRSEIRAIGLHGQTIRHLPSESATLQLASGPALAALTGIDVVHDLRSADVALGGQGAPLVPMFDLDFLHSSEKDRLVTNIGGITNVTYIPKSGDRDSVIAYDTGPGNMIIDAVAQMFFGVPYDDEGKKARLGKVNEEFLQKLLDHPYFSQSPPKSTGRELMQHEFIDRFQPLLNIPDHGHHALATATELTARTLAAASNGLGMHVELVLSGGGAKNTYLVERIRALLNEGSSVVLSHELGIEEQAKESIAFAYFAKARMENMRIHLPKTTGASRSAILGSIASGS
ncbi:MAG TPA: anhydro-N-acetylmuramic acid kinase [Candidatus Kapabacteria bacterium]|nr:anhydro-N-acetylmuramic acid kinase [Candidatus Kapabacteria bacterium]